MKRSVMARRNRREGRHNNMKKYKNSISQYDSINDSTAGRLPNALGKPKLINVPS